MECRGESTGLPALGLPSLEEAGQCVGESQGEEKKSSSSSLRKSSGDGAVKRR